MVVMIVMMIYIYNGVAQSFESLGVAQIAIARKVAEKAVLLLTLMESRSKSLKEEKAAKFQVSYAEIGWRYLHLYTDVIEHSYGTWGIYRLTGPYT